MPGTYRGPPILQTAPGHQQDEQRSEGYREPKRVLTLCHRLFEVEEKAVTP